VLRCAAAGLALQGQAAPWQIRHGPARREVITVKAGYAKNGEARSVPMNDTLTMLLKSAKVNAAEGERVFCNRYGQPYRSFRTAFERAVY
jgi:hypothetical protein